MAWNVSEQLRESDQRIIPGKSGRGDQLDVGAAQGHHNRQRRGRARGPQRLGGIRASDTAARFNQGRAVRGGDRCETSESRWAAHSMLDRRRQWRSVAISSGGGVNKPLASVAKLIEDGWKVVFDIELS